MFPEGHPYSWTTIGEIEDLFNATVEDVKEFHGRFYVPNNATLSISGDFDRFRSKSLCRNISVRFQRDLKWKTRTLACHSG